MSAHIAKDFVSISKSEQEQWLKLFQIHFRMINARKAPPIQLELPFTWDDVPKLPHDARYGHWM